MKHCRSRAKGYKFFMLNSAEKEIQITHEKLDFLFDFLAKIYIAVQVKTRFWRVHTIYVLDKKRKIMLAPLQPIVLLILKCDVRGSTSHDNFQIWSYRYLNC